MYLKRLELYGFKTFAERTELEFGPGITAIVGPNGSGKSNISDAILWVLGEQAMKQLRSARATDVIFNGSDSRKALGLAEVHLTLDNSAGLLPTDFTEVMITRRIFRSGESEYLINRVPVRLRDVQDLFLDTGIGKQSYSIISQGEVDAVLSSRSEDRRVLFEEVAGINKYKQRKKDALRKLEQTRQNLLRVTDIISELESQVAPLAEQSERARQYHIYHDEHTALRLALLVTQFTGLQGSLARAKDRETELREEQEGLRHALQQTEIRETTLRAELQTLEAELEERREVENRFASAVQAGESKLALLREQERTAGKERERLQQERTEWAQQSGQFDTEIATAEVESARLTALLEELEAERVVADVALQEAAVALGDFARHVQERRSVYLDVLNRAARVRNNLARIESVLRTSEGRRTRLAEEQAEVTRRLEERLAAYRAAGEQVTERKQVRERAIAQRTEALRARQAMAETLATLRREEHQVREDLAGLRARQRTLQELEESLEGYFPGVRAVVAATAAGTLGGWFAPVSEVLEVPAELEVAIEVALGANLQDLVTDTEGAAREAVAFLKRSHAGRATFLPLDTLSAGPRLSVPAAPGILGVAADLVHYEARYARISDHLLGRVLVAQHLDAALALAHAGTAQGWNRIVTLEGDVVFPSRAITGGSAGKAGGLLKRKRELQQLSGEVEARAQKADTLQRKCAQAAADLQRLDAEVTSLTKAGEQAAVAVSEAERAAATLQRDVASLEERAATLTKETTWIATEIATAQTEEAECQAALTVLAEEQRAAEEAITEAEGSLATGQGERDAITERCSALRLKASELHGAREAQRDIARRAAGFRDTLEARLAANARAEAELSRQIETLATSQQEATGELLRLREAYARSTGELGTAKDRRTALLDAVSANLEQQKAGRGAIEECQGRMHRAELRTTQVETELGFLEGQFFEDYRLTPDQAVARAVPVENRGVAVVRLKELEAAIEELGTVNLGAIEEFDRITERLEFLINQRHDLEEARETLAKVIAEIDSTCKEKFMAAFIAIGREFQDLFGRLFGGGHTSLTLVDPSDVLESGIEIDVTIPGKRNQNLLQLSGGERALTALALYFAMLRVKPSPFVVLDEIDAPLDEANVGRYCEVLRDFTRDTQFLIVTHNKGTMEAADVLYGVTMEKAGISRIVSVRLSEGHHAHAEPALAGATTQDGPFRNVTNDTPSA